MDSDDEIFEAEKDFIPFDRERLERERELLRFISSPTPALSDSSESSNSSPGSILDLSFPDSDDDFQEPVLE